MNFYNNFHRNAKSQFKVISRNNFTYKIILNTISSLIKGKINLDVLDYGCGVGTVDLYLAKAGHNIIGIDISKSAINSANESSKLNLLANKAKFYVNAVGEKVVKPRKFDLIICTEVLEHIKNDARTLQFLSDHLKEKGEILISVPSLNAPLFKAGFLRSFDNKVGHLRRYNVQSLKELVISSGLKILEVKKTEGILRNLLFTIHPFGILIKFIKGPLVNIFTFFDSLTIHLLGESDILIVAQKM